MERAVDVFISAASGEYRQLRERLARELELADMFVKHQGILPNEGGLTLEKLDRFIARSRLVVHILGWQAGAFPPSDSLDWVREHLAPLIDESPQLDLFGDEGAPRPSYTQWEALLALLHGKNLLIFEPPKTRRRDKAGDKVESELHAHLRRLQQFEEGRPSRYLPFGTPTTLAARVLQAYKKFSERPAAASEPRWRWPSTAPSGPNAQRKGYRFVGRRWVFAEIERWLRSDDKRVMMVLAPFGVGKSALMAELLARRDPACTAYHFCHFDAQHTLEPAAIVRSLARQLADNVPAYRRAVETSRELQRALDLADKDPVKAWLEGLVAPIVELDEKAQKQQLLVIDGLDESLELRGSASLLELIVATGTGRLPAWVRTVIASRPVPELDPSLETFRRIELSREPGDADAKAAGAQNERNAEDLKAFVRSAMGSTRIRRLLQDASTGSDDSGRRRFEDDLVESLLQAWEGKFLLARLFIDEMNAAGFDPAMLRSYLDRSRPASGMDLFYELTFTRRVARAGLDKAHLRAVLGLVAEAADPLPSEAIATVLGLRPAEVHAIYRALGGLLRYNRRAPQGITFEHYSVQMWLDAQAPEGRNAHDLPKAGEYAIDRQQARQRLLAHCHQLARSKEPLRKAGAFAPYLRRYGVEHLIAGGHIAAALGLLGVLREADGAQDLSIRAHEARLIESIKQRLHASGAARAEGAAELRKLPPRQLRELLFAKDYETDKFEPVIRALIVHHPQAWLGIEHDLLADEARNDIVLRHDIGVATAQAWHAAAGADRARLLRRIEELAGSEPGSNRREIAGYAIKHICQRRDPAPWYEPIADTIKALARGYMGSPDATDRMVGGEMVLALAIQGAPVMQWFPPEGDDRAFWQPCWANLRADVDATRDVVAARARQQLPVAEATSLLASCVAQRELAIELRLRLRDHPLFQSGTLARALDSAASWAHQQSDRTSLDECFADLARAVDGEHRGAALDFIRLLMLHPLWNETERAANLVAKLIKQQSTRERWWLVDELLKSEARHWRLRYGGIDAAYTAGSVDGYARFTKALAHGLEAGEANCRVRGICADDLGSRFDDATFGERLEMLRDARIAQLLLRWLADADDVWLLEYLHGLLKSLSSDGEPPSLALLEPRFPAALSPYLRFGDERFYDLDAARFMREIEQRAGHWQQHGPPR